MAKKKIKLFNKVFIFIVSLVFIIVFVRQFGSLQKAIQTLSRGSLVFLAAILLIQIVGIINKGAFYYSLYEFFGARDSMRRLTYLNIAANFLNLAAPSGGVSGLA